MVEASNFLTGAFVPLTNHRRHRIRSRPFEIVNSCHGFDLHGVDFPHATMSSSSLSAAFSQHSLLLSSADFDSTLFLLPDNPLLSPLVVVILAAVLLVSAQTFINNMLEGDQGLGAFLKDGSGYNRSGYRPDASNDESEAKDPLPWLKLPKLDFVEVAGQETLMDQQLQLQAEEQEMVYQELDRLKQELSREIQSVRRLRLEGMAEDGDDDMAKAKLLQAKLEGLMRAYGIEYEADE